jgi:peroxiredoxin
MATNIFPFLLMPIFLQVGCKGTTSIIKAGVGKEAVPHCATGVISIFLIFLLKFIAMRTYIFFLLFSCLAVQAAAQEKSNPKVSVLDVERLDVRDSTGKKYQVNEWIPLIQSGKYDLKLNAAGTEGLLTQLPDSVYKKRMLTQPFPAESNSFVVGTVPTSFSAKTIAGKKMDLAKLKGKVVVLNFWFINCPPCRQEMPELNQLTRNFSGAEVVFIGIALDEQTQLEQFLKQTPFDYQQIASGSAIAAQYGIKGYPTHAVLDRAGKVVFQTMGLGPNTLVELRSSIEKALAAPQQ